LRIALYECFTTHGIADSDPAVPPGPPLPVGRYPLDIATAAWDACKDTYVSAVRQVLNDFQGVVAEFPADADAFGFADCMAELGWITTFRGGQATDLAGYITDNTECRRPGDGSSSAASYCRLTNAIFDMAKHDPTMSITGIPALGDDNSRLAAAVHLYDELAEAAPPELVDDLRTVQDGFRQNGSQFPEAAWTRVYEYHASVCGAPVHLGSLD